MNNLALECKRVIVAAERVNPIICTHCQQVLPEKYGASFCMHCGGEIQPQEPVREARPVAPFKLKWWGFLAVLLAPPFVTSLAAFLGKGQVNEQASPVIAVFSGIVCGIACGIMLGLRVGKSIEARIAFGILFSVLFAVVCVVLSFFGCVVGGYQLKIE